MSDVLSAVRGCGMRRNGKVLIKNVAEHTSDHDAQKYSSLPGAWNISYPLGHRHPHLGACENRSLVASYSLRHTMLVTELLDT